MASSRIRRHLRLQRSGAGFSPVPRSRYWLAGVTVATATHAVSPASADVDLIRLCARQNEVWAQVLRIEAKGKTLPPGITPQSKAQEAWLADAQGGHSALVDQISAMRTATSVGVRAKTQVMLEVLERLEWRPGDPHD